MKYRFITIIHYLKLNKPDCRIPLASGMILNKVAVLKDVLSYNCRLSLNTLGRHSIDEFENQTFYVVDGEFEEGVTSADVDTFGTSLTFAFLRQIQALTNDFWTLRDNSIYVRDGFLFVYDNEIEDGVTFKASLSAINTKASTEIEDVTFSKEEIEALAKDMMVISVEDAWTGGANYRDVTQFQYYCDGSLGFHINSGVEPSGVRSKAAHGEPLKGTEQDVKDLLVCLDDYMRRLMKLDTPYDLDQEKINEYFIKGLMGGIDHHS